MRGYPSQAENSCLAFVWATGIGCLVRDDAAEVEGWFQKLKILLKGLFLLGFWTIWGFCIWFLVGAGLYSLVEGP